MSAADKSGRAPSMLRPRVLAPLTVGLALTTLVGCGGSDGDPAAAPTSVTPAPSATASASSASTPTATATPTPAVTPPPTQGSKGGVVLGGEDLGVTRLGEPFREAVATVSGVLGEPDEDPATTVSCIEADTEVRWGDLVLAARDDRLAGWSSRSATLQTQRGVAVGTPLSEVERVYGESLHRFPANPDNPPTFAVEGVDLLGSLSSADDDARVMRLFSSFCAGP